MKIGIAGLGVGEFARPDIYGPFVDQAEASGFDTLWLPEHFLLPENFKSKYPYARETGDFPWADVPLLSPYVSLAFAAGRTSRIRLGTAITLVPQYQPLVLAKLIGSLDYLSGGRLALGFGIGWLREEYEAIGVPWERRAARAREYVTALRTIWGSRTSTFKGEFVRFEDILSFPKPLRGADFPVIYGGHSDFALERATDYCNGIFYFNLTADETAERIARTRALLDQKGRGDDAFEYIVAGVASMTPADLPAYHRAGAHEVVLQPDHILAAGAADPARVRDVVAHLADEWLPIAAAS